MTLRQINMYAWIAIMWGSSFALLVPVIKSFDWVGAISFRAFIASAIVFIIAKISKRKLFFKGNAKYFVVLGLTNVGLNLGGMNYAIPRIGTQLSAIFVTTIPLYGLIIECIWTKKWPSPTKTIGLITGFIGVVILVGVAPQAVNSEFWHGVLGSTIAAIGFALGGNFSKMKASHIGAWEQTIGTFLFGGILTLPLLAIVPIIRTPSLVDIACLIAVAATASSFAYTLYFKLVAEVGPTTALSTEFLVPLVAVVLGYFLFRESLSAAQIVGSTIIIFGCALVMGLFPIKKSSLQS